MYDAVCCAGATEILLHERDQAGVVPQELGQKTEDVRSASAEKHIFRLVSLIRAMCERRRCWRWSPCRS
jgi:hypothetical protein